MTKHGSSFSISESLADAHKLFVSIIKTNNKDTQCNESNSEEVDRYIQIQMPEEFLSIKSRLSVCNSASLEVSRDSITISNHSLANPLGTGQFGIVYRGQLRQDNGNLQEVAVKKVKWKGVHETVVQSFVREVENFGIIGQEHPNIVGFHGACCDPGSRNSRYKYFIYKMKFFTKNYYIFIKVACTY